MSAYIEKSFCKGVVPAGIPAFNYERREQLFKMMGTGESVKVVYGPSGYGKTALCASFVNSLQNFRDTIWFDCMSPCFKRDLRNHHMCSSLYHFRDNYDVCVFDELPHLDDDDALDFLDLVELLSKIGTNVVINCAPEAKNRFLLDNFKFVISPKELLCRENDPNSIPAVVYSRGLEHTIFDSLRNYGLATTKILVYYCMLILSSGTFNDLDQFCDRRFVKRDLKFLAKAYPHIVVDFTESEFRTADFEIDDLKTGFGFAINEIINCSKFKKPQDFFGSLTSILEDNGRFERAANVAKVNLKAVDRLEWGVVNTSRFTESNNSNQILDCLKSSPQQMGEHRDEIHASLCHTHYHLSDFERATECAEKILRSRKAKPHSRLYACMVGLLSGKVEKASEFCDIMLEITSTYGDKAFSTRPFSSFKFSPEEVKFIEEFLITWRDEHFKGFLFLMQKIDDYNENRLNCDFRESICVCASFVFRQIYQHKQVCSTLTSASKLVFSSGGDLNTLHDLTACLVQFCFDCSRVATNDSDISFEILQACDDALLICEELCSDFLNFGDTSLFNTITEHRDKKREDQSFAKDKQQRYYEVLNVKEKTPQVPKSHNVKFSFFGGLTLEIDGRYAQTGLNRRQNCLYFLYLISKEIGHEVTRDTLIDTIWRSNMTSDSNKRNYYNTLSTLKTRLAEAVEDNPIKKNHAGIFLDPNLCSTDLQEFDALCSQINFNVESAIKDMVNISAKITKFSEPLLPQITKFGSFDTIRRSYAEKLVDALVFASMTLIEKKDFRHGLWFAREAKNLDRNREDTYCLIMKAQNGLNLRSSAVNTYFECKDVLEEELGMSPSNDMKDLYQMVIS